MDSTPQYLPEDKFPRLNLPVAPLRLRASADGFEVYDLQRRRWVTLTPEEWVRQHFVAMLISRIGYPASRIANEVGIKFNGVQHRCDTIVYGADRRPWMVVEYKAPTVKITQATFDQIARYNLWAHAPYLSVSNGLTHYICVRNSETGAVTYLSEMPAMEK